RLMRHSSLELTGRYTRPRAVDLEAAASLLPSLKPEEDRPEVMSATGTDATREHALTHRLRRPEDAPGRPGTLPDAMADSDARPGAGRKSLEVGDLTLPCAPVRVLASEAPVGVEPTYNGFADRRREATTPWSAMGLHASAF